MAIEEIIKKIPALFPEPYNHEIWLAGQKELSKLMREEGLEDEATELDDFVNNSQASVLMPGILEFKLTKILLDNTE